MNTAHVSIELTKENAHVDNDSSNGIISSARSFRLLENKKSFEFWKDSLQDFGYEHANQNYSFLDSTVRSGSSSQEGKYGGVHTADIRQSQRLRNASFGGRNAVSLAGMGSDANSALIQFFDLTSNRQKELFLHWDNDGDGFIGISEFTKGLKKQNLNIDDNELTRKKIANFFGFNKPENVQLSLREFATFLHRTKLAILFYEPMRRQVYLKLKGHGLFLKYDSNNMTSPAVYVPTAEMLIVDYNKEDVNICCANPNSFNDPIRFTLKHTAAKEYFFGSRGPEWTMRWLTVLNPDPISVITLAVKYRLHPLALEDMLQLNLQRPKGRYGIFFFY